MKRGTFKKPTYEEVLEKKRLSDARRSKKHPLERAIRPFKPIKPSKGRVSGKPSKSLAKLKKELDRVFSLFIRQKYANEDGMVKCYTCSTVKHWKEMQNGHWIPRNNLATRFHEDNCRVQCVGCNMFQKGMPDVFAVNLIKEGVDLVELQKTRYSVFKVDSLWYESKIAHYKSFLY
jgi:hypothetical protein